MTEISLGRLRRVPIQWWYPIRFGVVGLVLAFVMAGRELTAPRFFGPWVAFVLVLAIFAAVAGLTLLLTYSTNARAYQRLQALRQRFPIGDSFVLAWDRALSRRVSRLLPVIQTSVSTEVWGIRYFYLVRATEDGLELWNRPSDDQPLLHLPWGSLTRLTASERTVRWMIFPSIDLTLKGDVLTFPLIKLAGQSLEPLAPEELHSLVAAWGGASANPR